MLNHKSCKIQKHKLQKTTIGRPSHPKKKKSIDFSFEKVKENPDLMYQLKFTAEINKLIFKSPHLKSFYQKMEKEKQNTKKRKAKPLSFPPETIFIHCQKKRNFFDFMSLILESSRNQLGLSNLCHEVLSWFLQYFVKEMHEVEGEENPKINRNIREKQIVEKMTNNALINWKIHDYFEKKFFYGLLGIFEKCYRFFEENCQKEL